MNQNQKKIHHAKIVTLDHALLAHRAPLNSTKKGGTLRFRLYVLISFRPETALFRRGGVNFRTCLCGVPVYASAQALDFLATTKNPSFSTRKPARCSSGVSG
jgi:hypothetical protein